MKTFSVVHILLLVIFLLVYQCAKAQDFVVTAKGDTIAGKVRPLTYGPDKKVQITTQDKKKNTYSIFQIRGFKFNNEVYHPVKLPAGYTFMKLITPGYLSLYAFQQENQVNYDGLCLVKRDGTTLEVPNLTFKKLMTRFLHDCETVSKKIDDGVYGKKQLDQIIAEYNQCIDQRTSESTASVTRQQTQVKQVNAWDNLEEKLKEKTDLKDKETALEMIAEIKNKIRRSEKVPNFLIEGLKSSLANAGLNEELEKALGELNK
ncbi:hypothetical protein [Chryseosolibacter indicus]|uniref:DUF4369 domain-containing protein n=1 Tax=Chryseosolibacter indicus TaxID=2782351 RepID=A0ABS5VVE4_9BACT|nr:hypothetical protein [Chryseosolibacter indicus]MBT1704849.1 hypothetical protein [Chryseosolibacter indicus]